MPTDSTTSQGDEFERQVKRLLELHGFQVERNRYKAGRQTDLIAKREVYPARLAFLVECKDHRSPVGMNVVTDMHARVDGVRRTENADARGWIVAAGEFAMNARQHADSLGITCSTYAELERELINFSAYLHALIQAYESEGLERDSPITRLWVEPEVVENKTGRRLSLNELAREWLADPASNHLTLLGDYGTGKTWFTIKWAAELARAHLDDPTAIVPVRIELKEYSRALDFQTMIINHVSRYGIPASSFAAFEHLWRAGHILLILDAFDEMATQVDAEVTRRNFDELNRALENNPRARMLLTCRTHYFRDRPEVEEILERRAEEFGGTELYQAIVRRPNYRVAFLQEFDEPRIQQYLQKACGQSYEQDRQTIRTIYDLEELARRPVLLDMVVKSLPQLRAEGEAGRRVTAADLYQVYTRFWTERDDWRTSLTREGKRTFAQELARRLWLEQRTGLHWGELREVTQAHFKERLALSRELEYAEHEVRTASFLTRDAEGNYGFAHRSFLEFFVAQWLAPRLLDSSAPEMRLNEEIRGFVHGLLAGVDWKPSLPPEGVDAPEGMVRVAPGPFIYGEGEGTRVLRLERGFFVARTPVTNSEYARFVAATDREPPQHWKGRAPPEEIADHPVVYVTWRDAVAYAGWAGMRLPSEEQWEKAARGIDGREYPWGEWEENRCNTSEAGILTTTPVGRYSPDGDSPYGCVDMAGNVWEWMASEWEPGSSHRVVRGGSWVGDRDLGRCAVRNGGNPGDSYDFRGFRCVSPVSLLF